MKPMKRSSVVRACVMLTLGALAPALATAACSGQGTAAEARVGSSVAAISTSSIQVVSGTATSPFNSSTAAGDVSLIGGGYATDQLTVFQGTSGSTQRNGYTQRVEGSTSMTTVTNTNSAWGTPTLADSATLSSYDGPIKVAYLGTPNKFVIASAASSDNASGKDVDVVLVTTTDGGQAAWSSRSVLCTFGANGGGSPACPGSGEDGLQVKAIALAVDPAVSKWTPTGESDHDVWLYFTTTVEGGGQGRNIYFYEFLVTNSGAIQQLAGINGDWASGDQWYSLASSVCDTGPLGGGECASNADTFTMTAGTMSSCLGGYSYVLGAWASNNPFDDGACPNSTSHSQNWYAEAIYDYDSTPTFYQVGMSGLSSFGTADPDCVGDQVNWPAPSLAPNQDTSATGSAGAGSARISFAWNGGTTGVRSSVWTINPIGCEGIGSSCSNCCTTSECPGSTINH
jgi:hypothetical protein